MKTGNTRISDWKSLVSRPLVPRAKAPPDEKKRKGVRGREWIYRTFMERLKRTGQLSTSSQRNLLNRTRSQIFHIHLPCLKPE